MITEKENITSLMDGTESNIAVILSDMSISRSLAGSFVHKSLPGLSTDSCPPEKFRENTA